MTVPITGKSLSTGREHDEKMDRKGLFITFEGPDGAGKTTQIGRLAAELENRHIPYILTHEPGGTDIGDQIRKIILNPEYYRLTQKAEILLYAASRSQHVEEKIRPALVQGKIVLCDRFIDASIAYQGYGLGQPIEMIRSINRFVSEGLTPDRTYMIDIAPEAGRSRLRERSGSPEKGVTEAAGDLDRIEQRELDYHRRVREGFLTLCRENKQRICLINGEDSADTVFDHILKDFHHFLAGYMQKR